MNVWKKIGIGSIIIIFIFVTGFLLGSWRANQVGDINDQSRITELEKLNTELELGYTNIEEDYNRSEDRLAEFLQRESDRNDRALQILEGAGGKTSQAEGSIGRAIEAVDKLSKAIGILLGNE